MFPLTICLILLFVIHLTVVSPPNSTTSVLIWLNHTFELTCPVPDEEFDRIVWKKGEDELLAVGSVIFTTSKRVNVNFEGKLQISNAQKADSGVYLCQAGARYDLNQKHIFDVKVQDFKCPLLTAPKYGTIKYIHPEPNKAFTNASVAIYSCEIGYSLSTDSNRRNCTEKSSAQSPWDGNDPQCVAEEFLQLEDRLEQLESKVEQQYSHDSKSKGRHMRLPTDRLTHLEREINLVHNKQEDLKDWLIKTVQIINSSSMIENNDTSETDRMRSVQHQLNEMWMRVTLLHNELQTRMEDIEKTIEETMDQSVGYFKESNPKSVARLTDLSSLVSLRLGSLENETKNLEDALYSQNKLLEHVDAMNAIASAWEDTQKVAMARMRLVDGNKLVWEYIWIVHNIEAKIKKSLESSHFATQSNAFYTGVPGYKFRMVLYPNFDKSNQIGLFAGLLPGEFDDQVQWPFNWDFHMGIISHDPETARDHVGIISMPPVSCDVSNFQRPLATAPPSACGFRHFLSHFILDEYRLAYVTSGHLWIRIRIYMH